MNKELNCMNCSIGDFKRDLCDCDNGFCKEFKSIGKQEDFFNAVMQRIRPQGEWIEVINSDIECSVCGERWDLCDNDTERFKYCPNCGARMKGADDDR